MKSYCVREKRETECVPGTEKIGTVSNGRLMMRCKCASCGITKTQFVSGQTGGAVGNDDFSCGYDLRGKRPGTMEECFRKGQIRQWGVRRLNKDDLDDLLYDKEVDRMRARKQGKTKRKPMTKAKQKEYIDEIVADIKKETKARSKAGKDDDTIEMDSLLAPSFIPKTEKTQKKPKDDPVDYEAAIKQVLKMNPWLKSGKIRRIGDADAPSIRDKNYRQKHLEYQKRLRREKRERDREAAKRFLRGEIKKPPTPVDAPRFQF